MNQHPRNMTDEELRHHIAETNNTEFSDDDVFNILRSADGRWSGSMTGEEFDAHLVAMAAKYGLPY